MIYNEIFPLDVKLSNEEINQLETLDCGIPFHVVETHKDLVAAVAELSECHLLGFDTEKRPAFRRGESYPPAMVQLSSAKAIFIFRLKGHLPKELTTLFSNPDIIKAGVAVGRDISELRTMQRFVPANFVDLGVCSEQNGLHHHGLKGLVALLLARRLSKGAKLTNWERTDIPLNALKYAALDAWAGRLIYQAMKHRGCRMNPFVIAQNS